MANCIDINVVPVRALRTATRNTLAILLNPVKVIPSPNDLPRDWRGLEHLTGEKISRHDNPVEHILHAWEKSDTATLGQLQSFLAQLDRYDVLDDTREMMHADAENYLLKIENGVRSLEIPTDPEIDKHILTVDDVYRLNNGIKELQYYDAFLLYADDDVEFAMQIVDKLEKEYRLKLCLKDRDLIGGVMFEHEAIMRLIAERCHRLVVVVSQSFINSPANQFFVTFAQALGIEQQKRKVVPCLYTERFQLPVELNYYFLLDYTRSGRLWNFWDKLRDSICSPRISVTIKEITDGNECQPSNNNNHVMDDTTTKFSKLSVTPEKVKHKQPSSPTTLLRNMLTSKKSCKKKSKLLC